MSIPTSSALSEGAASPVLSSQPSCSESTSTLATEHMDKMSQNEKDAASLSFVVRGVDMTPIFSENALAKILQVAQRGLSVTVCGIVKKK